MAGTVVYPNQYQAKGLAGGLRESLDDSKDIASRCCEDRFYVHRLSDNVEFDPVASAVALCQQVEAAVSKAVFDAMEAKGKQSRAQAEVKELDKAYRFKVACDLAKLPGMADGRSLAQAHAMNQAQADVLSRAYIKAQDAAKAAAEAEEALQKFCKTGTTRTRPSGTTFLQVATDDGRVDVSWLGDSPAYLVRRMKGGQLTVEKITDPHTTDPHKMYAWLTTREDTPLAPYTAALTIFLQSVVSCGISAKPAFFNNHAYPREFPAFASLAHKGNYTKVLEWMLKPDVQQLLTEKRREQEDGASIDQIIAGYQECFVGDLLVTSNLLVDLLGLMPRIDAFQNYLENKERLESDEVLTFKQELLDNYTTDMTIDELVVRHQHERIDGSPIDRQLLEAMLFEVPRTLRIDLGMNMYASLGDGSSYLKRTDPQHAAVDLNEEPNTEDAWVIACSDGVSDVLEVGQHCELPVEVNKPMVIPADSALASCFDNAEHPENAAASYLIARASQQWANLHSYRSPDDITAIVQSVDARAVTRVFDGHGGHKVAQYAYDQTIQEMNAYTKLGKHETRIFEALAPNDQPTAVANQVTYQERLVSALQAGQVEVNIVLDDQGKIERCNLREEAARLVQVGRMERPPEVIVEKLLSKKERLRQKLLAEEEAFAGREQEIYKPLVKQVIDLIRAYAKLENPNAKKRPFGDYAAMLDKPDFNPLTDVRDYMTLLATARNHGRLSKGVRNHLRGDLYKKGNWFTRLFMRRSTLDKYAINQEFHRLAKVADKIKTHRYQVEMNIEALSTMTASARPSPLARKVLAKAGGQHRLARTPFFETEQRLRFIQTEDSSRGLGLFQPRSGA